MDTDDSAIPPAPAAATAFNVDQPGYRSTFRASADGDSISFVATFRAAEGKGPVANVMIWVDGKYVTEWWAFGPPAYHGHSLTMTDTGVAGEKQVAGVLDRKLLPLAAGDHTITVSAWAWPSSTPHYEPMAYRRITVRVPEVPVPALVPGKIVRVMLWSGIEDLERLGWVEAYKAAGYNAIHSEFFRSPYYTWGVVDTIEKFREHSIKPLVARLEWCRANGLYFWGIGDAMARMQVERDWVSNTPWAEQAIRETFAVRRRYRDVWIANSMVDEQPGHPDDWPLYREIKRWSDEEDGPPMSWPNQRAAADDPWEAPDVADFADRYYSANGSAWRAGLPAGTSGQPTTSQFSSLEVNLKNVRPGQPVAFIVSAMRENYFKRVEGSSYQPGDELLRTGSPATAIPLQMFLPLAVNRVSALRVYALDAFEYQRQNAPLGSEQQVACKPGTPEWAALAECNHAIQEYEQEFLGEWLPPGRVGDWVVGRRGNGLAFWINVSDSTEACPGGPGGREVMGGRVVIYGGR